MSDYTTPAASDSTVSNLADAIDAFARNTSVQLSEIKNTIDKYYTVDHEPKIELPFKGEYDYICEKVNKSLPSSKKLDKFTHIFISGYLANGKTIRYNALEKDNKGFTHSRYAGIFINGKQYYTDYTCRAEEGAREQLNVLIVGAPKMGSDKARLDVDYADIPLEDFKMVLYDDVDEPINPDIDSFLASKQIDTLKAIGNLVWRYSGLCTLRRLELTKDITVSGTMYCPCVQELIIPNVANVPDIYSQKKGSVVTIDISNVNTMQNLNGTESGDSFNINCVSVERSAFSDANIDIIDVGNRCQYIGSSAFANSTIRELYAGYSLSSMSESACMNCKQLQKVVFDNASLLTLGSYGIFSACTSLTSIVFGAGGVSLSTSALSNCTGLKDLTFLGAVKAASGNAISFSAANMLTEQSCLNIINAIAEGDKISVALHNAVKTHMANDWYCRLVNGVYISCTSEDEGAMLQTAALVAKGGTLA